METTVVIHGSALTSPASARDVDVIYVGDRAAAARTARGWAVDHGCGDLPLDLHESRHPTIRVPTPRGEWRPFRRLTGDEPVEHRPVDGLAAAMRRAGFDLAAFDAAFSDAGGGCRFGLTESEGAESDEWDAYVEGPAALRSALRHVRPEAWEAVRRARPERAAFVEALAQHGAAALGADLLRAIGGQAGGSPQKHVRVTEGEVAPLYSRAVGPWPLAVFTEMLRAGGALRREDVTAAFAAELAACREVGDADGGVALRRLAHRLGVTVDARHPSSANGDNSQRGAVADVVVRQIAPDDGEAWLRRVGVIPEGTPVVAPLDADLAERIRGKTAAFITATRADISLPQMALARRVVVSSEADGVRLVEVFEVKRV